MSANQSCLSDPRYGYDCVVAITQGSINATMKQYLNGLKEPETVICYVADDAGNPTPIDYATLLKNAQGSDPFAIPDKTDPNTDPHLQNLYKARFMAGFKAKIGLPPGISPAQIPDMVILGANTASVTFNLLCAAFTVVQYTPGGGYSSVATWMNQSQPSGNPWIFSSKVDLRLSDVDADEYSNLPADVKAQIKNMGSNAFSIQQLLFDLDNAGLESVPVIEGVPVGSNLYLCLEKDFMGVYFATMQSNAQPVLGYSVKQNTTDPASLQLTDLNLHVNPLYDSQGKQVPDPTPAQQKLYTLNYLCATNGNSLPVAVNFPWNWVDDPSQAASYNGAVAINKHVFVSWFKSRLDKLVPARCIKPSVKVTYKDIKVKYDWSLAAGQTPVVQTSPTGSTVLTYTYDATDKDQAGLHGDMGKMELTTSFKLTVAFAANTITINQSLVVYVKLSLEQATSAGNIVDKTLNDVYTLTTDENGRLVTVLTSTPTDNSKTPGKNKFLDFFDRASDLASDAKKIIDKFAEQQLVDIPVSIIQDYVFPGGKTFVFKDAFFSDGLDLVAHITYADPS